MKRFCNVLLLLLTLSVLSCNQEKEFKEKPAKTYSINVNKVSDTNFFALIDTAHFVVLETNDSSIIGEIAQLSISDKFILTDRKTNSILQFDKKGQHLSTHEAVGNGPGEYIRVDGIHIDQSTDNLYILDATQNKILNYTHDFKFINEIHTPVPFGPTAFGMLKDGTFVFEESIGTVKSDLRYRLFIQNADGETRKFLPFEKTASVHFSPRQTLYYVNDTLLFVPTYSNTIYNVFNDRVVPRMQFDFGSQWIDEAFVYDSNINQNPMLFIQKLAEQDFIYFLNVSENETFIYTDYYYKGEAYASIINKKKESNTLVKFDAPDGQMKPLASHGDYYVFPISRTEFSKIADNNRYTFKGKSSMVDIDHRLNEESNPILMFIKFK